METATHFEFYRWREAFDYYEQCCDLYGIDKVQFILSTHWCTSGYWIEPIGNKLGELSDRYNYNEVFELKKRIEGEINRATKGGGSPQFVR